MDEPEYRRETRFRSRLGRLRRHVADLSHLELNLPKHWRSGKTLDTIRENFSNRLKHLQWNLWLADCDTRLKAPTPRDLLKSSIVYDSE